MDTFTSRVYYKDKRIGDLVVSRTKLGVKAQFNTLDIQATLEDIGASYLNWVQICVKNSSPPLDLYDKPVKIPYIDPYPEGYALDPKFYYWNDGLGYYWDIRNIATEGNGYYDISRTLKNNLTDTALLFRDESHSTAENIEFKTWLVALDADHRLKEVFNGFMWSVKNSQVTIDICRDTVHDYI